MRKNKVTGATHVITESHGVYSAKERPKEIIITRADLEEDRKVRLQSSLILATSNMAAPLVQGKTPEEAMQIYSKMYDQMQDWFRGTPLKEQIAGMLDTMLPDRNFE